MSSEIEVPNRAVHTPISDAAEWLVYTNWSGLKQAIENTASQIGDFLQVPGSEFWSAIAGAVVGGLIAYWIQRRTQTEARNERRDERLQAEKALAYSLLFKVSKIYSNQEHIRRHVDTQMALREEAISPSGYLLALANMHSPIEFSADEMSMLLSLRNDAIFNRILQLDDIHNSIVPAWELYAALREKVKQLSQTIQFDPELGRSEIEVKKGSPLAIALFEADQMAIELIRRANVDAIEAKQALVELLALFRSQFGFTVSIVDEKGNSAERVVPS